MKSSLFIVCVSICAILPVSASAQLTVEEIREINRERLLELDKKAAERREAAPRETDAARSYRKRTEEQPARTTWDRDAKWYVELTGAAVQAEDSVGSGGTRSSFDDGYGVGIAFGAHLGGPVRIEIEEVLRGFDIEESTGPGLVGDPVITGSTMANLYVDIPLGDRFEVFGGGGAGIIVAGTDSGDDLATEFGWQLKAGLAVRLNPRLRLTGAYRFQNVDELDFGNFTAEIDGIESYEVGLRWSF